MFLNLDIIQAYLPAEFPTKKYGLCQKKLQFDRPLIYEKGAELLPGNLYIARAVSLPSTLPPENCGIICIGTHGPREWIHDGIPLLLIHGEFGVISIFNAVNRIFSFFDQWDASLRDAIENEGNTDIEAMLQAAGTLIGRNITVVDQGLSSLFRMIVTEIDKGKRTCNINTEPSPMSRELSPLIKEACQLERVIQVPYITTLNIMGRAYCKNLHIMGQFSGCISINEGNRTFEDYEFPLMDHFFYRFQNAFSRYIRSSGLVEKPAVETLRRLMNHSGVSDYELQNLSLGPNESWTVFRLRERSGEQVYPHEYMRNSLNAFFNNRVYTILLHDSLMGLIRVLEEPEDRRELFTNFYQFLFSMGYLAGLSNSFTDLRRIHSYYRQASYAISRQIDESVAVYPFRDCALNYMLSSCIGEMEVRSLLSPGLKALLDYDSKKGSEYVRTLDIYLHNEMSVTHTADQLYIHRSSLLKRLDKIQRIMDDNLENADRRLYYRICLALLKES